MSVSIFARAVGATRRAFAGGLPRTSRCRDFARRLPAYLNSELTEWQRLAIEVHIKQCRSCRQDLLASSARGSSRRPLPVWLRRLEARAALKARRGNRFDPPIDGLLPAFDGQFCRIRAFPRSTPSDGSGYSEDGLRNLVTSLAGQVPENYRIVWQLYDIEDMSISEVAQALDLTEDTVRRRLHKARAALTTLCLPLLERQE
ncbi:MAG: zf-HC2 domain-containing protein [Kiloniellales bacterium]|nr:zf-HC2 domain-containing protein [Kiloniellales bacterium]